MYAHQKQRRPEEKRNANTNQKNKHGFQRPVHIQPLDKEATIRREHFKRLVAGDPYAMAINLNVPVSRIEDLLNGTQPITTEVATFIEDVLELPPSSLDAQVNPDETRNPSQPPSSSQATHKTDEQPASIVKITHHNQSINRRIAGEPEMTNTQSESDIATPVKQQSKITSSDSETQSQIAPDKGFRSTSRKSKLEDEKTPVRLANLELLISNGRGIKASLCRMLGRADNLYSLLRSRKVILDRKLAKQVETIIELPEGWMEVEQHNVIEAKASWYRQASEVKQAESHTIATAPATRKTHRLKLSKEINFPQAESSSVQGDVSEDEIALVLNTFIMRSDLKIGPLARAAFQVLVDEMISGKFTETNALKMLNTIKSDLLT